MLDMLINAIKNKQVISFTYDGLHREAEPHAIGMSLKGYDVLRCYQTKGGHITPGHEWDLCKLAKIKNLTLTGACFDSVRLGYARGDKGMRRIYAEI